MSKAPSVITLLTDFGTKDGYVGTMKGIILRIIPHAQIVDLSEDVGPQDIFEGAFISFSAYKYFPKGTVHLLVVDPGVGSNRRVICVKTKEYTFVAPDNGILSLVVANEHPEFIIEVTNKKYFLPEVSDTFHGRDIFAPIAAYLLNGIKPEDLGNKIAAIKKIELPRPVLSPDGVLTAEIIYIDHFGNLITNIDYDTFENFKLSASGRYGYRKAAKGYKGYRLDRDKVDLTDKDLSIIIGDKEITKISKSYSETAEGGLLAIFGSSGFFEIAANKDNAKRLLKKKKGDKVVIEYKRDRVV